MLDVLQVTELAGPAPRLELPRGMGRPPILIGINCDLFAPLLYVGFLAQLVTQLAIGRNEAAEAALPRQIIRPVVSPRG
jgi:hypothetical protein